MYIYIYVYKYVYVCICIRICMELSHLRNVARASPEDMCVSVYIYVYR